MKAALTNPSRTRSKCDHLRFIISRGEGNCYYIFPVGFLSTRLNAAQHRIHMVATVCVRWRVGEVVTEEFHLVTPGRAGPGVFDLSKADLCDPQSYENKGTT